MSEWCVCLSINSIQEEAHHYSPPHTIKFLKKAKKPAAYFPLSICYACYIGFHRSLLFIYIWVQILKIRPCAYVFHMRWREYIRWNVWSWITIILICSVLKYVLNSNSSRSHQGLLWWWERTPQWACVWLQTWSVENFVLSKNFS